MTTTAQKEPIVKESLAQPKPDILAETLRLANAWYFVLYGVKPYPPQGAK